MSEQVYICNNCGAIEQAIMTECHCAVGVPFDYKTAVVIDEDLRADVLALCEAAEQYALCVQVEIPEWVDKKHGYSKDADEITALAKRISERLRGSDANQNKP